MMDKILTGVAGLLTGYFTILFVSKNYRDGDKSFLDWKGTR